jgi:membrane protein required for colicin V production
MKFTIFDLVNLTFFISSVFFGVYNGFIKSLINLFGFIVSIVGAIAMHPFCDAIAKKYVANEIAQSVLSVLSAYIISLIITSVIKHYALKFTSIFSGNIIDRVLGLSVGVVRGTFFCLIIFWVAMFFTSKKMVQGKYVKDFTDSLNQENYPQWFLDSETADVTITASDFVIQALPKDAIEYDLSKLGLDKMMNKAAKSYKDKEKEKAKKREKIKERHPEIDNIDKELLDDTPAITEPETSDELP